MSEYASMLDRELPRVAPAPCGLKLAEFFCCAGGIGLGLRSAGYELAFANDISQQAAASYAFNLGHVPVVGDIRGVDAKPLAGKVDVVTGGFPCVTFSTAGKRKGVTDDDKGRLYLELCRVISEARPRYFVAENVEGILNANGGQAVKLVVAAFLRLGYRVQYELVNMAEHGIPQARWRVIFVGVRVDQWRGSFVYPRKTRRIEGDKKASALLPRALGVRDAIGDLPPPRGVGGAIIACLASDAATIAIGVRVKGNFDPMAARTFDRPSVPIVSTAGASLVIAGKGFADATKHYHKVSPRLLDIAANEEEPATFSAAKGQKYVPEGMGVRRMSVRECARIQSFPDWYRFQGAQKDAYMQVGNAVPPLYAKKLGLALAAYDKREIVR